ncbi:helix-turn-helix domain-containing protein [Pelomonas sp. P7]|uniref:Helix-turn-helix domain-containing protein n=1 Tax=Pelomonas caseinilytica TaxID=2906763 RepID=A0ABS8XLN9_9BURK|nr:helix-turn-helix transcriptional regulator [Pelomonas sp. P7]MCE4540698.1 helix-turn-helix domain-containing protein [Pelomonas sp. P7]
MSKSLYSRHNEAFLKKLKGLRESRQLRQADLGERLGRSQGWVSYVESGATTLNVIELRQWIEALDYDFMAFLQDLDDELRWLSTGQPGHGVHRKRPPSQANGRRSSDDK